MSLNQSNSQIGQELDLNKDDVQQVTRQLREAVISKNPDVSLGGAKFLLSRAQRPPCCAPGYDRIGEYHKKN